MGKEKSCGGIIFRQNMGEIEFLIIQQRQGKHRFFPKGHVEQGESEEETALREIYEETGLRVTILEGFKESIFYIDHTKPVEKMVVFFVCESIDENLVMEDELENILRLPYQTALQQLTHDASRVLLTKAYNFLSGKK